jgi:tetratricopeptide (TPR) repeat protein/tRNA A-37 threonylcarbamoyl transferase component Bud32
MESSRWPRLEDFLAGAIADGLEALEEDELPPSRLGPWRILREIGRGGMATVYEAERDDREFERRVAVKVIRRGMDSADIVRRLRRERQILANLDHPGIARLLDGGTAPDGRPYVVMEFIDGEPIDSYCSRRSLGLGARLELFRQVCSAVHFAHKSLVLHRDIKPSNILVGADGQPKLLDFGIAKILADGGEKEDRAEPTRTGWRQLTPEWASPEQVRGEPLTTASDVYSLGLLLYLLIAGHRAYQVDARRPAELERIVCEVAPTPPSRLRGEKSGSPVAADDLDVVVLCALHKEPARRYASAEQLGEEVRRLLERLPILARRDSFRYRSRVFVRRHRLALGLAAATFLAMAATALVAVDRARQAEAERRRAETNLSMAVEERERAKQVAQFLVEIFRVSDPVEARGRSPTAREVLDRGAQRVRYSLRGDPALRADLLSTIGRVYQSLAFYEDASRLLEEALALRREIAGDGPPTAASLRELGQLALELGQYERAGKLAGEALALFESAAPEQPLEVAQSLQQLGDLEVALGRLDAAETYYRRALALRLELLGSEAEEVSFTRNSLGELLYRRGEYAPARAAFAEVLATRQRVLGKDHPEISTSLNNLAAAELALRRLPEAEANLREVLALRRRIYGENHPEVASALHNLAAVQAEIAALEAALTIHRRLLGDSHPKVADSLHNLGTFNRDLGKLAEADRLYAEALALRRKIYGHRHPLVSQTLRNLAELWMSRRPARAEAYFREALEIDRQVLPAGDFRLAHSYFGLGQLALARRELAAAEDFFRSALASRLDGPGADWLGAEIGGWLGHAMDLRGDQAALALLEKSHAELQAILGAENPRSRKLAAFLAEARRGRPR